MAKYTMQKSMKNLKKNAGFVLVFVVFYMALNALRAPQAPQDLGEIGARIGNAPTLVYFWGTWCHVCRHTSPKINALAQNAPVLGVAVQSDKVDAYLKNHGYTFANIDDKNGMIFDNWQGKVTPSYAIIKNGRVVQSFSGLQPLWVLKTRLWWAKWQ